MSHPGLSNLWQPDTHFLNAKKSFRPETVTRINFSGLVETRTRLAITTRFFKEEVSKQGRSFKYTFSVVQWT